MDTLLELPLRRLVGLFQAATGDVVEPPVIDAADTAVLHSTVGQIGATMCADGVDETGPALAVAKQHQILAEQAHRTRWPTRRELLGERGWLPVAAEEVSRGCAGPDLSQQIVDLFG
jgi:hypothetical protein